MKKFMLVTLLAGVMVGLSYASAYGWGSITHAYIAKELGRKFGYANLQEIYGSTLPDMVNLKNIPTTYPYSDLYGRLHLLDAEYQEAILREAKWCYQKAAAFGLISHRDVPGGADYTAHQDAASTSSPDPGYVYPKAEELIIDLYLVNELIDIFLPAVEGNWTTALLIAAALAPTVADFGVETGVDFLIKHKDPAIGLRLFFAASFRSRGIPYMLARAYSGGGLTAQIIMGSEREFREMMILYGQAFLLEKDAAIANIITQWMPVIYEIAQKLPYPIDTSKIDQNSLITLGKAVINKGIEICEYDYDDEIEATIDAVGVKLETEGIHTCPQW
jgi:hypothetical protein